VGVVRTQISLTEEQLDRLTRLAAERSMSMAALVRQAVDHVLIDADRDRRVDGAIQLVRRRGFRSGRSDIGREHDRYLEDTFES
jgi:predicted DNA-binding ribbon-helix-helix protein